MKSLAPVTGASFVMSDSNDSDGMTFYEVNKRVWVRWKHVPTCTNKILRPSRWRIRYLLDCMVEIAQKPASADSLRLRYHAHLLRPRQARPRKLEIHYRSARCR